MKRVDWWNLQPRWVKRIRLFARIVWRRYEGARMTARLSWDVAKIMHPSPTWLEGVKE